MQIFSLDTVLSLTLDSFIGLDATVCLFILSSTERPVAVHPLRKRFQRGKTGFEKNVYNPRYEVFLASRAIHKAVFVVPEMHGELVRQLKFYNIQVYIILALLDCISRVIAVAQTSVVVRRP